jgi:rubrerythrin
MAHQEVLDSLSLAIQEEISAYVFYTHVMERVKDKELIETLKDLARDEKDHFKLLESQFDSLSRSEHWITYKDALLADDLPDIDEKVTPMKQQLLDQFKSLTTLKDILDMALLKEKRAYEFYRSRVDRMNSPEGKETFEYLMNFELGHVRKVEGMIRRLT